MTHSDGIPSEHLPFTPKEGARSDQKYYSKPDDTYEKPSYEPVVASRPAPRQQSAVKDTDSFGSYSGFTSFGST